MPVRLHRGGRFRAWLGRLARSDGATGDRILRRIFHGAGAFVLLYDLLPTGFFVVLPTWAVLFLALAAVLSVEALRLRAGLEMPSMRPHEARRVASYAWYSVALVAAVLLFPPLVATVAVLGAAFGDPLLGELRRRPGSAGRWIRAAPVALYALGATAILVAGGWELARAAAGAGAAAIVAVAVEGPRIPWVDDDLTMTLLPGVVLVAVGVAGAGAPLAGI